MQPCPVCIVIIRDRPEHTCARDTRPAAVSQFSEHGTADWNTLAQFETTPHAGGMCLLNHDYGKLRDLG